MNNQVTQLAAAIHSRQIPAVRDALARGIDLRTTNYNGLPWSIAGQGSPQILELLLQAGAPIDIVVTLQNIGAVNALSYAIYRDYPANIILLLNAGADPLTVDPLGRTILHVLAANPEWVQRAQQLGISINQADRTGLTPLGFAIERYDIQGIAVLLGAGADPRATECWQLPLLTESLLIRRID